MAKVRVKVPIATGDPVKPKMIGDVVIPENRTQTDVDFDLRDTLASLAVKGNSLSADDRQALMGSLTSTLGRERAEKLLTHAYIFNSKPEIQGLSPEEKIKSFYTIGSNDPDVQAVIGRTKNLGYGVVPGFRESVSDLNQAIRRGDVGTAAVAVNPEVQRRIRLRIGK